MKEIHVKPGDGRICPMPSGDDLPEQGALVPHSAYWQRRLADGDAVLVGDPVAKKAPKEPKA